MLETVDLKKKLSKTSYSKTMEALRVSAETAATILGTVKSVNAVAGQVVITGADGKDVTVTITDATKVLVRGALFGVLGVSAGMRVEARYDTTTGIASAITAMEAGAVSEASVTGTVSAVDAAGGQITINVAGGGTVVLKTGSGTKIRANGKDGSLASIKAGDRIHAEYNADTKIAATIQVDGKGG